MNGAARSFLIGTGWKMNKTLREAKEYAVTLRGFAESAAPSSHLFIVPPFTTLALVCDVLKGCDVMVGAQNMHWEEHGAFTGEISAPMIRDCGASIVELGHSERRSEFGETDFTVNKKVLAALRHGLCPLVCIGESAIEKSFGTAREFVVRQTIVALHGVSSEQLPKVILAYEPVWAIGVTGTPANPEYANLMHKRIREALAGVHGEMVAEQVHILYGGSVNRTNAASFAAQPEVDGLFIGRAAWSVEAFIELIHKIERTIAFKGGARGGSHV